MSHIGPRRVLLASTWQNQALGLELARYAQRSGWRLDLQMHLSGDVPQGWRGEGIVTLLGGRSDLTRFIRNARAPVVCLTVNQPDVDVPRVDVDNRALARMAAEHLLQKGFRSFA